MARRIVVNGQGQWIDAGFEAADIAVYEFPDDAPDETVAFEMENRPIEGIEMVGSIVVSIYRWREEVLNE